MKCIINKIDSLLKITQFSQIRSIKFFETGLHQQIIESKVTFFVRLLMLLINLAEDNFPDEFQLFNEILKDKTDSEWRSLSYVDLESLFGLFIFSYLIIC